MAKVKIQGHASGTGVFTLTSPNSNTDRTITLPDGTGTLAFTTGDDDKLPLAGGTMTGNIAHAGTFTLDVGGDLILDADGGGFLYKDGGTEIGRIFNSGSDFAIKSIVQDKDLKFQGNDGGSAITALTLDMSDGGVATFNAGAQFGGNVLWPDNQKILLGTGADLEIFHDGSHTYIQDVGTGNLRIRGQQIEMYNPDGSESIADFNVDGAVTLYHNGSAKLATSATGVAVTGKITGAVGSVLQTLHVNLNTPLTITHSNSWQEMSGLSIAITPSSSSSKILILAVVNLNNSNHSHVRLRRVIGGSEADVGNGNGASNRPAVFAHAHDQAGGNSSNTNSMTFLDSPNTTSAITYKLQANTANGSNNIMYINRTGNDANAIYAGRGVSSITVMEIGA